MIDTALFYVFALMTLGGGILCITRRNAVHAAIWLIASLMGVAGLFLLQRAEFLFAVQIVLYIGGIMVLFLFVIMLINLDTAAAERQYSGQWKLALGAVVLAGGEIAWVMARGLPGLGAAAAVQDGGEGGSDGNVERLADLLFSEYLLPFEIVSILLLAAIVGSVFLARRRTS